MKVAGNSKFKHSQQLTKKMYEYISLGLFSAPKWVLQRKKEMNILSKRFLNKIYENFLRIQILHKIFLQKYVKMHFENLKNFDHFDPLKVMSKNVPRKKLFYKFREKYALE